MCQFRIEIIEYSLFTSHWGLGSINHRLRYLFTTSEAKTFFIGDSRKKYYMDFEVKIKLIWMNCAEQLEESW